MEVPEQLKEDIAKLASLEIKERPEQCCYLMTVDPKGNWGFIPKLYEIVKTKEGGVELREFKYKMTDTELKVKKKLAKIILDRLDWTIRKGIGKEIRKALIEKPRKWLEEMAASKGQVKVERRRGCFWLVDRDKNQFSL